MDTKKLLKNPRTNSSKYHRVWEDPLFSKKNYMMLEYLWFLYPLTAFRAMSKAAEKIYKELSSSESQENMLGEMQTRDELYDYLSYHKYEKEMDDILNKKDE